MTTTIEFYLFIFNFYLLFLIDDYLVPQAKEKSENVHHCSSFLVHTDFAGDHKALHKVPATSLTAENSTFPVNLASLEHILNIL